MNPEADLKQLGAQALQDLYNNLVNAKAFALEHAPDVCQQMITWQITKGILAAVTALLVWVAAVWVARRIWRWEDKDGTPGKVFGSLLVGLATLTSIILYGCFIAGAIQAIVAPKLFLVESIAGLLK